MRKFGHMVNSDMKVVEEGFPPSPIKCNSE